MRRLIAVVIGVYKLSVIHLTPVDDKCSEAELDEIRFLQGGYHHVQVVPKQRE